MPPSRCLHAVPLRSAIDSAIPSSRSSRCLSAASSHSFSTSSQNHYAQKGVTTLRLKKKGPPQKSAKPPEPGERRAIRKRIVLSNTNALSVRDVTPLNTEIATVEKSGVYALPPEVIDQLRSAEAFKPKQGWSFFQTPAVLMRKEARALGKEMDEISGKDSQSPAAKDPAEKATTATKSASRKVIVGDKGAGKSVLLLQAMAMAFQRGWIVINLPDGREIADGHTTFSPVQGSNPIQYSQPAYAAKLLKLILSANGKVLQKLSVTEKPKLPFAVKDGITLAALLELGANDQDRAWPIFQAFWRELTKPNSSVDTTKFGERPPVLMCLDNMSHVTVNTGYQVLDEVDKLIPVHSFDLALVRHFAQNLSGEAKLPNGGMVLAATSASDGVKSDAMRVGIAMAETRQSLASGIPVPPQAKSAYSNLQSLSPDKNPDPLALSNFHSPYVAIEERVVSTLDKTGVIRLAGLDRAEATTLMKYWTKSGMYRDTVLPWAVDEARALSGGAVIGELEGKVVRFLQRMPAAIEGESGGKKIRAC